MGIVARVLLVAATLLALLAAVLVARTLQLRPHAVAVVAASAAVAKDSVADSAAIARLAAAIRIPTVSYFDSSARVTQFQALHAHLATSFPRLHAALRREVIDSAGLLFTWPGTDTTLAPVFLMGHIDVVPVEPGTEKSWTHPAFGGEVADGFVWGRGALDDKSAVMAMLEATEQLVAQGHAPRRTLMLAFGYTEEKGGPSMPQLMRSLAARGVKPHLVVDEGGFVTDGVMAGVTRPVALIGIAEKGYLSVRITAKGAEGHSSMPPRATAVGVLSKALSRISDEPMPARLDGGARAMLQTVGAYMPFVRRMVMANLWLFRPVLLRALAGERTTDAMIRTTIAPTMLQASSKDNVLPGAASAVVNLRLLPGDSVAWAVRRLRDVIADDRVTVAPIRGLANEASPVSPTDADGYRVLRDAVSASFPSAVVTPYLVMGATDGRYLTALTPNVYRFAPFVVTSEDIARVHGTNERIAVANYLGGIAFERRLIMAATR